MERKYTEIPNSIFDETWGKSFTTVGLYVMLALLSDNGVVATSYGRLSSRTGLTIKQLRVAMSNLETSGYIKKKTSARASKEANKRADQLTEITICRLNSCEDEKNDLGKQKDKQKGTQKERGLFPLDEETPPIPPKEVKPLLSPKENPSHERARKAFVKPTVEEIEEYIRQKGYNIDAEYFWNFYETNGWVQGRNQKPIKNWKSCVATWIRKQDNHATTQNNQQPYHDSDHPTTEQLRQQTAAYIASRLAQD